MKLKQKSKTTEMPVTEKHLITSITQKEKEEKDSKLRLKNPFHQNNKKINNLKESKKIQRLSMRNKIF